MSTITLTDLAWSAGIIDGEGCIHIRYTDAAYHKGSRNPQHTLYLKVTMTSEKTVRKLHSLFGVGSIQTQKPPKGAPVTHNIAFTWLCTSLQAAKVLTLVRPYLFTKLQEADVALKFANLPRANGSSKVIPPDVLRMRHELYTEICLLKPTNVRRGIKPLPLALTLPGVS